MGYFGFRITRATLNGHRNELMKLRYLTQRRPVTAEQVNEFAKKHQLNMPEAKRLLTKQKGPTLQYWNEDGNNWCDVEQIMEYVEE